MENESKIKNDSVEITPEKDLNSEKSPSSLIELALNKNASIEVLERLFTLQERWENNKAKEAFAQDFVKMKPELPLVIKSKENKQTSSKYAALEDVNKVVDPILAKYGFGTAAKIIEQTDDSLTVEAELWHKGGHVERTRIKLPIDDKGMQGTINKTRIHGTTSTLTYGKRVAICALLNISTGDDKDGNASKKNESGKQEREIIDEKISLMTICETEQQVNEFAKSMPKVVKDDVKFKKAYWKKIGEINPKAKKQASNINMP